MQGKGNIFFILLILSTLLLGQGLPPAARAAANEAPVAMVEDLGPDAPPGVEIFTMLREGERLELGEAGSLTLGYLQSCVREKIVGGTVIVGREQSRIVDGKLVEREVVACGGGRMLLTRQQLQASGAVALRVPAAGGEPDLEVNSRYPLFLLRETPTLALIRLGGPRERHELAAECRSDGRCLVDLVAAEVALAAGGLYRMRVGTRLLLLQVAAEPVDGENGRPATLLERSVIVHP